MLASALEFPKDIPSTPNLYNLLWPPRGTQPAPLTVSVQPACVYVPPLPNQLHG